MGLGALLEGTLGTRPVGRLRRLPTGPLSSRSAFLEGVLKVDPECAGFKAMLHHLADGRPDIHTYERG